MIGGGADPRSGQHQALPLSLAADDRALGVPVQVRPGSGVSVQVRPGPDVSVPGAVSVQGQRLHHAHDDDDDGSSVSVYGQRRHHAHDDDDDDDDDDDASFVPVYGQRRRVFVPERRRNDGRPVDDAGRAVDDAGRTHDDPARYDSGAAGRAVNGLLHRVPHTNRSMNYILSFSSFPAPRSVSLVFFPH